jgi:hypothetical protein
VSISRAAPAIGDADALSGDAIDQLVRTAVFGDDAELRGTARWRLRTRAAAAGIRPASIQGLYRAMGRGAGRFTVPAFNIRAMAYDTMRAVVRAAKTLNAGALIFEISRGEMGYTYQRPHEYAAVVLGAALREGFEGSVFIQGDHVQINANQYHSTGRETELDALRALITEEIAAGFYNMTSFILTLSRSGRRRSTSNRCSTRQPRGRFLRSSAATSDGDTISVGGRSAVRRELGCSRAAPSRKATTQRSYSRRRSAGISRISVEHGTAHGASSIPTTRCGPT